MKRSLYSGLAFVLTATPCHAENWRASVVSKFQVDNRETQAARAFVSLWGSFEFEAPKHALRISASGAARQNDLLTRQLNHNSEAQLYRLFIEKTFQDLGLTLKGGRFQRADSLGLYNLDGASVQYSFANQQAKIGVYGGVPRRIDDLRSTSGDYVVGWEGWFHWKPDWQGATYLPLSVDRVDLRTDLQRLNRKHDNDDRITLGFSGAGQVLHDWLDNYETTLLGTYRIDNNTFEDVTLTTQLDVNEHWRWRNAYEYFHPRGPNPSFREAFTTRYALSEQDLFRTSVHYEPDEYWRYFIGAKRASRSRGDDGYGMQAGITSRYLAGYRLSAEFDYLTLMNDEAYSFYFSASHSPTSQLRLELNTAFKLEEKQLYGENIATGAEMIGRYMFNNHLFLNASTRFIWNSRLNDEYLGSVELIYYFEKHRPKGS